MKLKFWILLIALMSLGGFQSSLQAQENQHTLKVLTYNLRFGELASLQELGEYIKSHDPDIVALQEVDINTIRERAPHQNNRNFIAELGYYTGMFSSFAKAIPYRGGWYGVGILSKHPIKSTDSFLLPFPEGSKEQRVLQVATVELSPSQDILVANTHLDYPTSEVRQAQVKFINGKLSEYDLPKLLFGDLNAEPSSPEIKSGMEKWRDVSGEGPTVPTTKPKRKIDYIFGYPQDRWVEKYSESLQEVFLSDHLPVVAEIELAD